jgi:hypothetical protein
VSFVLARAHQVRVERRRDGKQVTGDAEGGLASSYDVEVKVPVCCLSVCLSVYQSCLVCQSAVISASLLSYLYVLVCVYMCLPCLLPPSRVMLDDTFRNPCQASSPPDTRACARPALGRTLFGSSPLQILPIRILRAVPWLSIIRRASLVGYP